MELSFLLLLAVLLALSNVHGFTQSGTLRQSSRHLVGFRAASSSKRSVIITGGNRGIGYECAARLLQSNICDYDIVLACRSIDLGEEAKSRMMKGLYAAGYLNKARVSASEELCGSVGLKLVLRQMLAIGNIMNEGTHKGQASGITLDSLLKLTHTKGADKKTTVLDYVVTLCLDKVRSNE